ncbi:hypothetical protein OF83DRAFT_1104200 [Amylostereum chailletii]|nr:hypothetical protein OF83DRAFT_1104200 [Amylostereum chailletii]
MLPSNPRDFWLPVALSRFSEEVASKRVHSAQVPNKPRKNILAELEDELEVLSEVVTLGRRWRNSFTPVSSLPPEILLEIFDILRDVWPYSIDVITDQDNDGSSDGLGWIRVTHVCHSWRQIALNCATLWRHVHYTKLTRPWANELLLRSRLAPLDIDVLADSGYRASFQPTEFFQQVIDEHSQRLRDLILFGRDIPSFIKMIPSSSRFPVLESLQLENRGEPCEVALQDAFAASLPRLKWLDITDIIPALTPCTTPFPCLKWLMLSYEGSLSGIKPTIDQLSTLLRCMPMLFNLEFVDPAPDDFDDHQPIPLPPSVELCSLMTITSLSDRSIAFYKLLSEPASRMTWSLGFRQPLTSSAFLAAVLSRVTYIPGAIYLNRNTARHVVDLKLFRDPWPISTGSSHTLWEDHCVYIEPPGTFEGDNPCQGLPLGGTLDLTYRDDEDPTAERWVNTFKSATKVRRLRVVGKAVFSLFDALDQFHSPSAPDDSQTPAMKTILFPELESLSILEPEELFHALGDFPLACEERLMKSLRARRESGTPIRHIKLPKRFLYPQLEDRLRGEGLSVAVSRSGFY